MPKQKPTPKPPKRNPVQVRVGGEVVAATGTVKLPEKT